MTLTQSRRSLAPAILLLVAFAHAALALRFVENEWDLKRGQAINISWEEATKDVNIDIYLARKVPGRAELQLNLNRECAPRQPDREDTRL